jgi:hypothetical protein
MLTILMKFYDTSRCRVAACSQRGGEASESGQPYRAKDTQSAITAIQEGAVISGILGLENCEQTEVVDNECPQALRDIQTHGLLTTLKNYSDRGLLNETASA